MMKPHVEFHHGKWHLYPDFWGFDELFSATTLRLLAQKAQQNEEAARVGEQQNCFDRHAGYETLTLECPECR